MTIGIINFNIYNRSADEQNEISNGLEAISKEFFREPIVNVNVDYKTVDVPGTVYLDRKTCKIDADYTAFGQLKSNTMIINVNCAGASLFNAENASTQIGKYNQGVAQYNESRYDENKYDSRQNPPPPARPSITNIDHRKRITNNIDFLATEISKIIDNTHARDIKVNLLVCKSDEFADELQQKLHTVGKNIKVSGYRFVYDVNKEYFISHPTTLKNYTDANGHFTYQQIKDLGLEQHKISLENKRSLP